MNEEELKKYLKKHLTISLDTESGAGYDCGRLSVRLLMDGEEISTDSISLYHLQP
jgi:hypothetical protein